MFYDIKWISSCVLNLKKTQQIIPKNRPRYTKKNVYVKCNKTITALHFVQHDVLWSTEKQYWPRPLSTILIFDFRIVWYFLLFILLRYVLTSAFFSNVWNIKSNNSDGFLAWKYIVNIHNLLLFYGEHVNLFFFYNIYHSKVKPV